MKKNAKYLVGGLVGVAVVVAAYFGASGGMFQGKIDLNTNVTRAELMKLFTVPVVEKSGENMSQYTCAPFSDVKATDWAAPYVCYMYKHGVVKGYADGTFGPDKSVTRAEAAKMVDVLMGLPVLNSPKGAPYTDVPATHWFSNWDDAFANYGIGDIKGWVGAKFYPDQALTKGRAQYWANNLAKVL